MSRLLLHACCGVCSAYVPELLIPHYEVAVYYENSNLYPSAEFERRREAAEIMAASFGLPLVEAPYRPVDWFKAVRGHAQDRERGARCGLCIRFRLDRTFVYAKAHDFEWVATTLSVSRRKNSNQINALGQELAAFNAVNFLGRDWKKNRGEDLSQARAKAAGIYRQNYCGCVYSHTSRITQHATSDSTD